MSWWTRFANGFRPRKVSGDIDREMAFHLAERAEELTAAGLNPEEARRQAQRRFGNYTLQKDATRERDLLVWLDTLLADLRFALRALRRTPGFTTVALLSLALGIGANTAIFSLINVATLKTLPVRNPDELVVLTQRQPRSTEVKPTFSQALWEQIRDRQNVFEGAFAYGSTGVDLSSGGESHPAAVGLVTGKFFSTLGVRPAAGRLLMDADDRRGHCQAVAVITHSYWRSQYAGDAGIVGRVMEIAGRKFQIVGVTEAAFFGVEYGYYAPVWVPHCAGSLLRPGGYSGGGWIMGRLKPGITLAQSQARLATLAPTVLEATLPANGSEEDRAAWRQTTFGVAPFAKGIPGLQRTYGNALLILMAAVGLVLLIACANLANLLLARAAARRHEIAVRLALGAGRWRVVRQLLTESLLLSFSGAAAGVLFAGWASRLLISLLTPPGRIVVDVTPDGRVLGFTIALGVVTGILFGLGPAWRMVRVQPNAALKPLGRGIEGSSRFGTGKAPVTAQVALSLVAIAGAGMLLESWRRQASIHPGFQSQGVLVASVNTGTAAIPANQRAAAYQRIVERLGAIPGVTMVSAVARAPFGTSNWRATIAVDGPDLDDAELRVPLNEVSPGYFATLGVPILAGRDFHHMDLPTSPAVAMVSEEMARKFFGGVRALGQTFHIPFNGQVGPPVEIAGIVANTKEFRLGESNQPVVYLPLSQNARPFATYSFALRSTKPAAALVPAVQAALADVHPRLSSRIVTLQSQVDESLRLPRALSAVFGFFAGLSLLLAAIGLYGIMSYSVARRQKEIGVRLALGATPERVVRTLLADLSRILPLGLAAGGFLSVASTRLAARLYQASPQDPANLALSALILATVALAAALIPARRSARLDPVAALREE